MAQHINNYSLSLVRQGLDKNRQLANPQQRREFLTELAKMIAAEDAPALVPEIQENHHRSQVEEAREAASDPTSTKPVQVIEQMTDVFKKQVKLIRTIDHWDESPERQSVVRASLKTFRDQVSLFEKHTGVTPPPKKTLFEDDADIPEHLQQEPFLSAWNSWWDHRKKAKKSVSQVTKTRQLNQLKIGDAKQAALIVSKAEENGWQGIPDAVWIPKHDKELWDGRMPVHADAELKKRIEAALNSTNGFKAAVSAAPKAQCGKFDPTKPKLTLEEQIARAKR